MSGILLVPIHLDALWLEKDLSVVEPRADFSRLPFWDGTRDMNPDVANLGEEIVAHPFQDKGFQLRAGMHLHWALPDALTQGSTGKTTDKQKKHNVTFPAVPNRWLVSRSRGDADIPEQQWIVESDHLHPETTDKLHHAVSIPFPGADGHPPFRYLGRRKPFPGWAEDSRPHCLAQAGYQLTAVGYERRPDAGSGQTGGYGEATFAAFYPNCHSVFGFHDPTPAAARQSVRYEVIGWYSDPTMDPLRTRQFLDAIATASKALPKEATDPDWRCAALAEVFRWEATVCWVQPRSTAARRDMPDRTVCYARLEFDAGDPPTPFLPDTSVSVAVGNTSTEALSAYLAGGNVKLEDQLEALHLERRLDGKTLDIGFKFMEARHEKGFSPVGGGTLWTIRPATSSGAPETDPGDEELPDGLRPVTHLLNQLNLRQAEYDAAVDELVSMRRQLFADWHKYMLSAYPADDRRDGFADVDEARHFIENYGLLPVKAQQARVNALEIQRTKAAEALRAELDLLGKDPKNKPYVLQRTPAPRYWQPHEPAILIVDECVEPSRRHGQDGRLSAEGLLACQIMPASEEPIHTHITAIRKAISAARPGANEERIGFDQWSAQPWNPFALEWCVEVFPLRQESNVKSADGTYSPAFVTTNYELAQDAIDLQIRPGQVAIQPAISAYSGSSLITPHAKRQLESTIKAYLKKQDSLDASERDRGSKAIGAVYARLTSEGFHAMAQKLGGFNDALLMHRHILQLPIAEPLGLDESRQFTGRVRDAVDNQNRSAPQPHDGFHPIRSGALRIRALRLVDTFGRTRSLTVRDESVFVAEALGTPGAPHLISLPPRIAQPARLNFRWLAAENAKADEMEMNAHPATSPICGWLLLNDLDESLMVYDSSGTPLGSIDSECALTGVPGTRAGDEPKIDNRYLNTLLLHLKGLGATQFKLFLAGLQRELEQIDPEGHAQQEALALLIGRPMAVVRATIDLQIRGLPAINQSWASFTADLDRYLQSESTPGAPAASRDTDAFTRIQFPIRLGDHRQLNDGVIGFWKESWSRDGKFCVYEQHGDPLGRGPAGDADLLLSIDNAPQKLTMLIDPRATVHASSGILPMKSIRIPTDQYADALKRIEVTFLCAPVLTPRTKISIPLPGIAAAAWKWRTGDEKATDVSALTTEVDLDAKQEIREGWLQLTKLEE